jgi:hypothetical protein
VLRSQAYYDYLRDSYLWPIAHNLRPHNAAKNPLNPLRLLHLSQYGADRVGPRLQVQVRWEAKRQLATAFGFMTMELAHPESWLAREVERIEELSSQKLFAPADLVDVYAVYAVDRKNGGRVIGTPFVTLDERVARRVRRRPYGVLPRGGRILTHHFQCRTVLGPAGVRWLVEYDDRRKTYYSRKLKLDDGGSNRDSCGTSQVVAARQDADGTLHLGTRADVDAVLALTEDRLWRGPELMPFTIPAGPKRRRHGDYWDRKLVGYIAMQQDGLHIRTFVEQIITSLTDHLNQIRATDALNHEIRRAEQLVMVSKDREGHIPPAHQYWPAHIYTKVNWTSEETIGLLRRRWALRFAERARKA